MNAGSAEGFHPAFVLFFLGTVLSLLVWRRYSVRRALQAFSLTAFVALFWLAAVGGRPHWPVDFFLFSDPLVAVVHSVAGRVLVVLFLVSLAFVALAAIMGRVFCSHVCPMGTMLDISDRWLGRKQSATKNRTAFRRARKAKFAFLVVMLAAALAGLDLLGFGDPLVLFTRFAVIVFYPLVALLQEAGLDALRALGEWAGWIDRTVYVEESALPAFEGALVMAGLLVVLLLLSRMQPRFWCRHLCPLGGLLAWIGRWAPYRRRVSDACTGCNQCVAACPMGAIHADGSGTDRSECIVCLSCVKVCPEGATRFDFAAEDPELDRRGVEIGRRAFVGAAAGGLVLALEIRADILHPSHALKPLSLRHQGLIRPPGALPEPEFLSRCLRCGACMRACKTNTLQPDWYRAGLEGLWAPRMNLRHAACDQTCNVCGEVCPSRAIRPLSLVEKRHAKVGTAVISRDRCLPWSQDLQCLICEEQCPYGAVSLQIFDRNRARVPVVEPSRCNGCGICEDRCPLLGDAAIAVSPHGELRLAEGSYIAECGVRDLSFEPKARDRGPFRVDDASLPGQSSDYLRELGEDPPPEQPFEFAPPGSEIDAGGE